MTGSASLSARLSLSCSTLLSFLPYSRRKEASSASQAGSDSRLFVMKTHQAKETKQMLAWLCLLSVSLWTFHCFGPPLPASTQHPGAFLPVVGVHQPGLSWQGHWTKRKMRKSTLSAVRLGLHFWPGRDLLGDLGQVTFPL